MKQDNKKEPYHDFYEAGYNQRTIEVIKLIENRINQLELLIESFKISKNIEQEY